MAATGFVQRFKGRITGDQYWFNAKEGITALAGGGQTSATLLTGMLNRVTTVASGSDSVALPSALPGRAIIVTNASTNNAMQVFGQSGDTINGVASTTGVAQTAGYTAMYVCTTSGVWYRFSGV